MDNHPHTHSTTIVGILSDNYIFKVNTGIHCSLVQSSLLFFVERSPGLCLKTVHLCGKFLHILLQLDSYGVFVLECSGPATIRVLRLKYKLLCSLKQKERIYLSHNLKQVSSTRAAHVQKCQQCYYTPLHPTTFPIHSLPYLLLVGHHSSTR